MADKLPGASLRRILIMTAVVGVMSTAVLSVVGISLSSLFSGLQGEGPSQAINDELGEARAERYIGESQTRYGSEQWIADNSQFETEQPFDVDAQPEVPALREPPDVANEPDIRNEPDLPIAGLDPTAAAMAQINNEQGTPVAQQRSAEPMSNEIRVILEAQQREDERRAVRAQEASIAPLGDSIHSPEDLYGASQRAAAEEARRLEEERRAAARADLNRVDPLPVSPGSAEPAQSGHILAAGTVIRAGLLDAIDSELPGLVRAMVTSNVWDTDTGRVIVIPQGSQLLGEYISASSPGQRRMGIIWNRVRFPNGNMVELDSAVALAEGGGVGVEGRRRNGFLVAVFQTALLNLAGSVGQTQSSSDAATLGAAAQIALGQGVDRVGTAYINESLARGSIFRIDAGTYINVQITRDFFFPDAVQHRGDVGPMSGDHQTRIMPASAGAMHIPYDPSLYGGWVDVDDDCQDTRDEMLELLSMGPITRTADGCAIVTGRWLDPYTDVVFTQANQLAIDHLVPLAWAHIRGGANWSAETKSQFANDPINLLAVDPAAISTKGVQGYDQWLPPAAGFQCQYILRFEHVMQTYGLTYLPSEAAAVQATRDHVCSA